MGSIISTMFKTIQILFFVFVGLAWCQEDECYQVDTNCYRPELNEIGHTPYMPDIWACELACRDTPGCTWFTWYENTGYYMCYLLTACDSPQIDDKAVSGKIEECTPDTTPTRMPTWTSPRQ